VVDGSITPTTNNDIDLGTSSYQFKDGYFDGTLEADDVTIGGTNVVTGSLVTTLGTVSAGVWQGTAIASTYIAADAITGAKIADDAINSEHYTDGSIDNAHLADDAVDSDELAAGAVDTAHIGDNQVTAAKIFDLARGSVIIGNASAATAELTIGSNTYVLASDGTDIAWTAAAAGGLTATPMTISTNFETAARFGITNTSAGTSVFGDGNGLNQDTTATISSATDCRLRVVPDPDMDIFAGSPVFSTLMRWAPAIGASTTTYFGLGEVTVTGSAHTFTTDHIGFKTEGTALHGTQGNGTSEEATSSLATISLNVVLEVVLKVNGTSSVDYYFRTAGGALSSATNLTSDMPNSDSEYMQFSASNEGTTHRSSCIFGAASYTR
jgi:hypothetical protein